MWAEKIFDKLEDVPNDVLVEAMWNRFLTYKSNSKKERRASLAAAIITGTSMMDNNKNAERPYEDLMDKILTGVEF